MKPSGFTLLELSIVLVIIGLLAGGVVVGRHLLRNATIRTVGTEYNSTLAAVNTFKVKYRALPGDMKNATSYWGALDGGNGLGADCYNVASTDKRTCNGDGDGFIGPVTNDANSVLNYEAFRFWQHLANAGLIKGTYTGMRSGSGQTDSVVGVNVLEMALDATGMAVAHIDYVYSGDYYLYNGTYGHFFYLGGEDVNGRPDLPIFTANEASILDAKYDDGFPATGTIRTYIASRRSGCASNDNKATATYATGSSNAQKVKCNLLVGIGRL